MDEMIEFNFTRRQSEVSLNIEKDTNSNSVISSRHNFSRVRKPVQRSNTYTPRDLPRISRPINEAITLPERFRRKIQKKSANSLSIGNVNISSVSVLDNIDEESGVLHFSDRWEDRKSDIEAAIDWIRQEVTSLKKQDKVLKRRLEDLGATIQQLKGIQSCPSLAHSRASISSEASWFSLDDNTAHRLDLTALPAGIQRDNLVAFRARMVAEFQKSNPSLLVHSKAASLSNVVTGEEYLKHHHGRYGSSLSSSNSGVFVASNSSGDDEEDVDNERMSRSESFSNRSDSLVSSMEEDTLDNVDQTIYDTKASNDDLQEGLPDCDIISQDDEEDNNTLKLMKMKERLRSLSSDDSSTDLDCSVTYEDGTLTRDHHGDKTITDSLEDILTAVSTAEEREGNVDPDGEIEYMV